MGSLIKWWFSPAKWWQFWKPESGLIGGTILGILISTPLLLLLNATMWRL